MVIKIGCIAGTSIYFILLNVFVCVQVEGVGQSVAPAPKNSGAASNSKNAAEIALQKCEKYAEYRYVKKWIPEMAAKPGYWYNITDCVNVVTLINAGMQAKPKEYPHMALIGFGNDFQKVEWACGGSLISEKFILSAASCVDNGIGSSRWALLGDLNITSMEDQSKPAVYEIKKIYAHPNFKRSSVHHNIALFELNTTVEMSPYVRPACLHTSTSNPVNTKGSITGWGLTGAIEERSSHLLKATISIIKDSQCIASYNHTRGGYNPDSMICAGDLVEGRDTCNGDSGGPLQIPNKQVCVWDVLGITSFGPGICGNLEDPGVYTKVAFYLDWIQSIVWP